MPGSPIDGSYSLPAFEADDAALKCAMLTAAAALMYRIRVT